MAEILGKDERELHLVLQRSQKVTRLCFGQGIQANVRDRRRYLLKFETFIPHKDHPDVNVSERGSSGPMKSESVSVPFCSANSQALDA